MSVWVYFTASSSVLGFMMRILIIVTSFLISACASYSLNVSEDFQYERVRAASSDTIQVKQLNHYAKGVHCWEPMFFVVSLGLIPTHCVNDYEVFVSDESVGKAWVTMMSGWLPPLLSLLPGWTLKEPDVKEAVIERSRD